MPPTPLDLVAAEEVWVFRVTVGLLRIVYSILWGRYGAFEGVSPPHGGWGPVAYVAIFHGA